VIKTEVRTAYPAPQRLAKLLDQSLAKSFEVIKRLLTVLLQETVTHGKVDIWCEHSLVIVKCEIHPWFARAHPSPTLQ
jgi:hypothetical protein